MSQLMLPTRKPRYMPKELGERHREVIRLYALGGGLQEIADQMGLTRHSVRYIVNSPLGIMMRKELQERRDDAVADVSARLAAMCPKAIDLMNEVVEGKAEGASLALRIRTCESVLDRAGYGKITKSQNQNLNASLTAEDIINLQKSARQEAAAAGVLAQ